jgi:hypothetical protein
MYETSLSEDDIHYKFIETKLNATQLNINNAASSSSTGSSQGSVNTATDPVTVYPDLFEMKNFIVSKLIDLAQLCNHEENMMKIIRLFEKVRAKIIALYFIQIDF